MRTICLTSLLVCALAAPAAAQEPVAPDTPFPVLATTDRTTDHSSAHSSLAVSIYEDDSVGLPMRLDLGGQYLTRQGVGGYVAIPVSLLDRVGENVTALGSIELGGIYVAKAGPSTRVVVRGGLALPTAADDLAGQVANLSNLMPRFTDHFGWAPDTTALRLAASPLHRSGRFFARADLGLDIEMHELEGRSSDPMLRLNLAAGVETAGIAIAGELVTVGATGDVDQGRDRFLHTLAISGGMGKGNVRPFGALIVPVDEVFTNMFAIMAGVEATLGTE
jgi:hypothetical protein